MLHSPEPRVILSVRETPLLDRDKGGGPRFGHQRCFPWQRNVFSAELVLCTVSNGSSYSRNRKVLQIIWQHTAPSGAACCQARIQFTQLTGCVFVCNNRTCSISQWWRFDCADADVTYTFFFSHILSHYTFANLPRWTSKLNYPSL